MKAVVFDGALALKTMNRPERGKGQVLIRVSRAGICRTDHEITRGYVPEFRGILGHEFIGVVEEADDTSLVGKRATAEINAACGVCDLCKQGLGRHCPHRTVLGISGGTGAFADYLAVPADTVITIPDEIPDTSALFIEPLAAACEVLEQVPVEREDAVLLIGDGKLAMLLALVLKETGCRLQVVGKHARKLTLMKDLGILNRQMIGTFVNGSYDIVVEASGNPEAFALAVANTRPRGTLVLKSTYAQNLTINPSAIVVNELTIVGSRCGRFEDAVAFLLQHKPDLSKLITAEYPIDRALEAFTRAQQSDALKVVLRMGSEP